MKTTAIARHVFLALGHAYDTSYWLEELIRPDLPDSLRSDFLRRVGDMALTGEHARDIDLTRIHAACAIHCIDGDRENRWIAGMCNPNAMSVVATASNTNWRLYLKALTEGLLNAASIIDTRSDRPVAANIFAGQVLRAIMACATSYDFWTRTGRVSKFEDKRWVFDDNPLQEAFGSFCRPISCDSSAPRVELIARIVGQTLEDNACFGPANPYLRYVLGRLIHGIQPVLSVTSQLKQIAALTTA